MPDIMFQSTVLFTVAFALSLLAPSTATSTPVPATDAPQTYPPPTPAPRTPSPPGLIATGLCTYTSCVGYDNCKQGSVCESICKGMDTATCKANSDQCVVTTEGVCKRSCASVTDGTVYKLSTRCDGSLEQPTDCPTMSSFTCLYNSYCKTEGNACTYLECSELTDEFYCENTPSHACVWDTDTQVCKTKAISVAPATQPPTTALPTYTPTDVPTTDVPFTPTPATYPPPTPAPPTPSPPGLVTGMSCSYVSPCDSYDNCKPTGSGCDSICGGMDADTCNANSDQCVVSEIFDGKCKRRCSSYYQTPPYKTSTWCDGSSEVPTDCPTMQAVECNWNSFCKAVGGVCTYLECSELTDKIYCDNTPSHACVWDTDTQVCKTKAISVAPATQPPTTALPTHTPTDVPTTDVPKTDVPFTPAPATYPPPTPAPPTPSPPGLVTGMSCSYVSPCDSYDNCKPTGSGCDSICGGMDAATCNANSDQCVVSEIFDGKCKRRCSSYYQTPPYKTSTWCDGSSEVPTDCPTMQAVECNWNSFCKAVGGVCTYLECSELTDKIYCDNTPSHVCVWDTDTQVCKTKAISVAPATQPPTTALPTYTPTDAPATDVPATDAPQTYPPPTPAPRTPSPPGLIATGLCTYTSCVGYDNCKQGSVCESICKGMDTATCKANSDQCVVTTEGVCKRSCASVTDGTVYKLSTRCDGSLEQPTDCPTMSSFTCLYNSYCKTEGNACTYLECSELTDEFYCENTPSHACVWDTDTQVCKTKATSVAPATQPPTTALPTHTPTDVPTTDAPKTDVPFTPASATYPPPTPAPPTPSPPGLVTGMSCSYVSPCDSYDNCKPTGSGCDSICGGMDADTCNANSDQCVVSEIFDGKCKRRCSSYYQTPPYKTSTWCDGSSEVPTDCPTMQAVECNWNSFCKAVGGVCTYLECSELTDKIYCDNTPSHACVWDTDAQVCKSKTAPPPGSVSDAPDTQPPLTVTPILVTELPLTSDVPATDAPLASTSPAAVNMSTAVPVYPNTTGVSSEAPTTVTGPRETGLCERLASQECRAATNCMMQEATCRSVCDTLTQERCNSTECTLHTPHGQTSCRRACTSVTSETACAGLSYCTHHAVQGCYEAQAVFPTNSPTSMNTNTPVPQCADFPEGECAVQVECKWSGTECEVSMDQVKCRTNNDTSSCAQSPSCVWSAAGMCNAHAAGTPPPGEGSGSSVLLIIIVAGIVTVVLGIVFVVLLRAKKKTSYHYSAMQEDKSPELELTGQSMPPPRRSGAQLTV